MSSTTYVALVPRSPRPSELESGPIVADTSAAYAVPSTGIGTRPALDSRGTDTFQRGKNCLRNLGIGAASGLGFGALGGLAASSVATFAWLGSDGLTDDWMTAEASALWKAMYRSGLLGHTVVGAVVGVALEFAPEPLRGKGVDGLPGALITGQLAGGAVTIGGALVGSLLGNLGTFVFDVPADPTTKAMRRGLAIAGYLAGALPCTYGMLQESLQPREPSPAETTPAADDAQPPPAYDAPEPEPTRADEGPAPH